MKSAGLFCQIFQLFVDCMIGFVDGQRGNRNVAVEGGVRIQLDAAPIFPDTVAGGFVQIVSDGGEPVGVVGTTLAGDADACGIFSVC